MDGGPLGGWGGGGEACDEGDHRRTALREAVEESHGILSIVAITKAVNNRPLIRMNKAIVFGMFVPWGICDALNTLLSTQRKKQPIDGCFEKKTVRWIRWVDVENKQRKINGQYFINDLKLRAPLRLSACGPDTLHTLQVLIQQFSWGDWHPTHTDPIIHSMNRKCNMAGSTRSRKIS